MGGTAMTGYECIAVGEALDWASQHRGKEEETLKAFNTLKAKVPFKGKNLPKVLEILGAFGNDIITRKDAYRAIEKLIDDQELQ